MEVGDKLQCRNCPYGKEDFERRMNWYNKTIEEYGIPNDIYGYLQSEDAADEFEQSLWCDKVGGNTYRFGHCTESCDDLEAVDHKNSSKQKRSNRRERDLKYKQHLKRLTGTSGGFPSGATYTDEIWIRGQGYVVNPKPYYKRLYRGKRSKYLKKQSHRKIRRYKGELHNGCMCNRLYDFWWEYC